MASICTNGCPWMCFFLCKSQCLKVLYENGDEFERNRTVALLMVSDKCKCIYIHLNQNSFSWQHALFCVVTVVTLRSTPDCT